MLSDKQIKKFQRIYKNEFGKEISRKEVYEKGTKLIQFMGLIYKPMTLKDCKVLKKRRKKLLIN